MFSRSRLRTVAVTAAFACAATLGFASSASALTYAYGQANGYAQPGDNGAAVFAQAYVVRENGLTTVHCEAQSNGAIQINLTCGRVESGNNGPATTVHYVTADPNVNVCFTVTGLFPLPNRYKSASGCAST